MATKSPTPQAISRLLAKVGFERSVSHTTRIKGWHDWNEGYKAERGYGDDPPVIVRHRMGKWARGDAADKRHAEHLAAYAETITKAGYRVEHDTRHDRLIVTEPDSDSGGEGDGTV